MKIREQIESNKYFIIENGILREDYIMKDGVMWRKNRLKELSADIEIPEGVTSIWKKFGSSLFFKYAFPFDYIKFPSTFANISVWDLQRFEDILLWALVGPDYVLTLYIHEDAELTTDEIIEKFEIIRYR